MKRNMSKADRYVRFIISLGIAVLIYLNVISGTAAWILGIIGGIFLLTAATGFCPLYTIFGMSTKKSA